MGSAHPADDTSAARIEQEVVWLHEKHAGVLLRYACFVAENEETARDAVQEIFLRYLVERRHGRKIENPRAWLYQVLRNYLSDRKKAACAQAEVAAEQLAGMPDPSHDPETLAVRSQVVREIESTLSGRELECLELRAEGLSYREIGTAMDVRTGTVGALLSRALDKIQRLRKKRAGDKDSGCTQS